MRAMNVGGSEFVTDYQQALTKHDLYEGDIDGIYDANVSAALTACVRSACRLLE